MPNPQSRLLALAAEAKQQYLAECAAGGEPAYPAWIEDALAVCGGGQYDTAAPGISTVEDARAEQVTAILWAIMRDAQAAKEPCGDDPESATAIRNGKLATIAGAAAQALGLVRGPDYPAPAAGDARDAARLDWLEQHDGRFYNKDRISSIVGTGFLVAGDEHGVRHQTVRAAIDAAIAAQRQGDA